MIHGIQQRLETRAELGNTRFRRPESALSKGAPIRNVAIIARLKDGCEVQAAELLAEGPPFDLEEHGFDRHVAYLSSGEVMFVFEGVDVDATLDDMVGDPFIPALADALDRWRPLIEGDPRVARAAFEWNRDT